MRLKTSVTALLLVGACAGTDAPSVPLGKAQLDDLSVMFPLAHSQAELDSYLTPASPGSTGSLLPEAIFSAAETNGITYADLRLVSFRLDPCFAQLGPITDPSACDSQIRLVFQPLTFQNGSAAADDDAVHAFYRLDRATFEAAVKELVALREASGGTTDLGGLAPHPIVVEQGLTGELATQLRASVLKYAGSANLIRFTLFRSSGLFAPSPPGATGEARFWSFHGFDVAGNTTTPMEIPTLPAGTPNENFSSSATQPLHGSFQLPTASSDDMQILGDYPTAQVANAAARQSAYDAALRIENPSLHSPKTIDCVSCHMAQPARQLVGEKYFGLSATGNSNAFVADPSIPASEVESTTPVLDEGTLNLHAFSYRDAAPMINQRVINETAAIVAYVNAEVLTAAN